jgi:membrane protease YdiL (CAAX protease family)
MPGLRTLHVALVFFGTLFPVLAIFVGWNFVAGPWHTPAGALIYEYTLIAIFLLGVGVLGVSLGRVDWSAVGFRRCSADWIIRAFLLAPMLYGFANLWRALLIYIGHPRPYFPEIAEDKLVLNTGSTALMLGLIAAITIFTPIAQEALLRGILYAWLRRYMSFAIAAVACSPIFGLFHINIERLGSAMIVGIVMCALYEGSRSIWPAIVLHVTVNWVYVLYLLTD